MKEKDFKDFPESFLDVLLETANKIPLQKYKALMSERINLDYDLASELGKYDIPAHVYIDIAYNAGVLENLWKKYMIGIVCDDKKLRIDIMKNIKKTIPLIIPGLLDAKKQFNNLIKSKK